MNAKLNKVVRFSLVILLVALLAASFPKPVDASLGVSCRGVTGWSSWYSMSYFPKQTRTISFLPTQAGNHIAEFKSSNSVFVIKPRWEEGSSKGTWNSYIVGTRTVSIPLYTGSRNVRYYFTTTETLGKYTRLYFRVYCGR
jgi:hypothetical protein